LSYGILKAIKDFILGNAECDYVPLRSWPPLDQMNELEEDSLYYEEEIDDDEIRT
jgi:hypothetical protein